MMRRILCLLTVALASPIGAQRSLHAPLAAQLPLGPRALSLGGLTVGSREAESALGNPALAGGGSALGLSLSRYRDGAHGGVVGMTTAVGIIGVGVAVSYLDYASAAVGASFTDAVLVSPGSGAGSSMAGAVSLSMAFKGLRYGVAATYLEERLEFERASVAGVSLGAAKDGLFGGMTLGMALQNVGPSFRFTGADVDLPTRLAAGISGVNLPVNAWFDFTATGGIAVRRDGLVSASAGGELTWVPIEGISVALRTGVRRAELAVQRPFTGGGGLAVDRFTLDYAWEQMRGGGAHRIGMRLR